MIQKEIISYRDDEQSYEGLIAWDDALVGPRPGVLVAHTFRGQGPFENSRAEALAALGYTAMAIDLYGTGRRARNLEEANALMAELNTDRPLLLKRIQHSLDVCERHEKVDGSRMAAIGFCFGGKCVLDLARSGREIKGVVSFHGIYDPPPMQSNQIHSSILVLHGWEDPLANPASVLALATELTDKQADWQILAFGHTGHAFTNRNAADKAGGMFYQSASDARSWLAMRNFLNEKLDKQDV